MKNKDIRPTVEMIARFTQDCVNYKIRKRANDPFAFRVTSDEMRAEILINGLLVSVDQYYRWEDGFEMAQPSNYNCNLRYIASSNNMSELSSGAHSVNSKDVYSFAPNNRSNKPIARVFVRNSTFVLLQPFGRKNENGQHESLHVFYTLEDVLDFLNANDLFILS